MNSQGSHGQTSTEVSQESINFVLRRMGGHMGGTPAMDLMQLTVIRAVGRQESCLMGSSYHFTQRYD